MSAANGFVSDVIEERVDNDGDRSLVPAGRDRIVVKAFDGDLPPRTRITMFNSGDADGIDEVIHDLMKLRDSINLGQAIGVTAMVYHYG